MFYQELIRKMRKRMFINNNDIVQNYFEAWESLEIDLLNEILAYDVTYANFYGDYAIGINDYVDTVRKARESITYQHLELIKTLPIDNNFLCHMLLVDSTQDGNNAHQLIIQLKIRNSKIYNIIEFANPLRDNMILKGLSLRLNLDGISRTIIVPSTISYSQLAEIINTAFELVDTDRHYSHFMIKETRIFNVPLSLFNHYLVQEVDRISRFIFKEEDFEKYLEWAGHWVKHSMNTYIDADYGYDKTFEYFWGDTLIKCSWGGFSKFDFDKHSPVTRFGRIQPKFNSKKEFEEYKDNTIYNIEQVISDVLNGEEFIDYLFDEVDIQETDREILQTEPISLKELIDHMDMNSNEDPIYYNIETNEFLFSFDHDFEFDDYEDKVLIKIPDKYDINEYTIMDEFIESLKDNQIKTILKRSIQGAGAFRYFHNKIHELNIQNKWYRFKDKAYRNIAIEWCLENNLLYI